MPLVDAVSLSERDFQFNTRLTGSALMENQILCSYTLVQNYNNAV